MLKEIELLTLTGNVNILFFIKIIKNLSSPSFFLNSIINFYLPTRVCEYEKMLLCHPS